MSLMPLDVPVTRRTAGNAGGSADDFKVENVGTDRGSASVGIQLTSPATTVMLATEDHDLGLVLEECAQVIAQDYAHESGLTVYLRDPVNDEIVATFNP